jgi:excinuclease ABC subunit A
VIVIEHNLDVIKTADWIIDMGPEGGSGGGMVIATGTPEEVAANDASYTGQFLRQLLETRSAAVPAKRTARKTAAAARRVPAKRATA